MVVVVFCALMDPAMKAPLKKLQRLSGFLTQADIGQRLKVFVQHGQLSEPFGNQPSLPLIGAFLCVDGNGVVDLSVASFTCGTWMATTSPSWTDMPNGQNKASVAGGQDLLIAMSPKQQPFVTTEQVMTRYAVTL
jgi:hypothetical protein